MSEKYKILKINYLEIFIGLKDKVNRKLFQTKHTLKFWKVDILKIKYVYPISYSIFQIA